MKKKLLALILTLAMTLSITQTLATQMIAYAADASYDYGVILNYEQKSFVGSESGIGFSMIKAKPDKEYAVKFTNVSGLKLNAFQESSHYLKSMSIMDYYATFEYGQKGNYQFKLELFEASKGQNALTKGAVVATKTFSTKVFNESEMYLSLTTDTYEPLDNSIYRVGDTCNFNIEISNFEEGTDLSNIFSETGEYKLVYTFPQGCDIKKVVETEDEIYGLNASLKFTDQTKKDFTAKLMKGNTVLDEIAFSVTPKAEITATPTISTSYDNELTFGELSRVDIVVKNAKNDWEIDVPEFSETSFLMEDGFLNFMKYYNPETGTMTYLFIGTIFNTTRFNKTVTVNVGPLNFETYEIDKKYSGKVAIDIKVNQPVLAGTAPSKVYAGDSFDVKSTLSKYSILQEPQELEGLFKIQSNVEVISGSKLVSTSKNTKKENSTATTYKAKSAGTVQIQVSYALVLDLGIDIPLSGLSKLSVLGTEDGDENGVLKKFTKTFTVKIEPTVSWKKQSGKWYGYVKGMLKKNSWVNSSGKWYYLDSKGAMEVNAWVKSSGKWYYVDGSGAMKTNAWVKLSGKWYYFDGSGAMKTNAWAKSSGKWYYFDGSGKMLSNTSKKIGKKTYKFNSNGVCTNP
ncbi:MAG: lytA 4 [Oscillospiraceae bacterium]|jgi:hypothetical protein|nr:lytA 4 [Oscillospiraceae bacterium]